MKYSIDTSAILHAWRRSYPPKNFPSFWSKMEKLIDSGKLKATEEVLFELEKKDDEVYEWALSRNSMFVPIDIAIQQTVQDILQEHSRLLDTRKNRSGADPFVIALAKTAGCTVVTNESQTGNLMRPNIPDVCDGLGIRFMNILGLIIEEQWVL